MAGRDERDRVRPVDVDPVRHRVTHKDRPDFGWYVQWDGDVSKLPLTGYFSWEVDGDLLRVRDGVIPGVGDLPDRVIRGTTVRLGYYLLRVNTWGVGIVYSEVDAETLKQDWRDSPVRPERNDFPPWRATHQRV